MRGHSIKQRQKQRQSGERQLASLALKRRSDDMDRFPNDPLETAILIVTSIAIAGGVYMLWHLSQVVPQ